MGKKKTRDQAYRAAALEAALDAVAKSVKESGSGTVDVPPEEVLAYAKFILGGTKKKRRRGRKIGTAYVDLMLNGSKAYTAEKGTPLPESLEDLEAKGWRAIGYLAEDGLKEDPAFSVADLFRKIPDPLIPGPPTIAGATLEKFAKKVRDGDLAADPVAAGVKKVRTEKLEALDLEGALGKLKRETDKRDRLTDLLLNGGGTFPVMPGTRHEDAEVAVLDEGKAAGCEECAAELERRGLTDLNVPDPWETSAPVGEDPGDGEVLTQWAEEIRRRNAEQEAALEGEILEQKADDHAEDRAAVVGALFPPDRSQETLDNGSPGWDDRPEVRDPEDGLIVRKEDGTTVLKLTPHSTPAVRRRAEEELGFVAGTLDDEGLTITNEGTFLSDGTPAEKDRQPEPAKEKEKDLSATWAPQRHAPETSANAPDHVVRQGASLGCPECSAEADRRKERDEALDRGRVKLGNRLPAGEFARTGPLDEDELLAIAGSELYPAGDEEPSRELKIRNRLGEVRAFAQGGRQEAAGWTSAPLDGWSLRLPWTSSEMERRGPWHIV